MKTYFPAGVIMTGFLLTTQAQSPANLPAAMLPGIHQGISLAAKSVLASTLAPSNQPTAAPSNLPSPTPATASVSHEALSQNTGVVLTSGWDAPFQGGSETLQDLSRLFSSVAKSAANISPDPSIEIYSGISFLTPFEKAVASLGVRNRPASKNPVTCPGFPRSSFFYYAVDGSFEGHYNRMYVVVDRADQVVSVQLVDETPREKPQYFEAKVDWATYNFVNARTKAASKLRIDHQLFGKTSTGWAHGAAANNSRVFRVDSILISPTDKYGYRGDLKEQVRWYVPRPLAELILLCVQRPGTAAAEIQAKEQAEHARQAAAALAATPPAPSPVQPSIEESLANSTWSWSENVGKKKAWFRLNPDGSATAGWHNKPRTWKVLSPDSIELQILGSSTDTQTLRFNSDFTEARQVGGEPFVFKRLK